ncbi:MAG: DNA/RNA non-specific endonuclease, partial [Bacteroidota bacterium]
MKALIGIVCLLMLFGSIQAQKIYSDMTIAEKKLYDEHIIQGQPDPDKGPVYIRQGYILKYNKTYKIADWVAYHIIPDYLNTPKREKKYKYFKTDKSIEDAVMDKNYTGTGYARGHMAPYFAMGGDRDEDGVYSNLFDDDEDAYDDQTVFEANYMSNIAPQDQNALNGAGGPWYALETKIRKKFVDANDMELNVVVGGIFDDPDDYETMEGKYGGVGIAIPEWYFQVLIYQQEDGAYITAGFLFKHVKEKSELPYDDLVDYLVPVDSLEDMTGFDFLNELSDELQDRTESVDNREFWVGAGL